MNRIYLDGFQAEMLARNSPIRLKSLPLSLPFLLALYFPFALFLSSSLSQIVFSSKIRVDPTIHMFHVFFQLSKSELCEPQEGAPNFSR